MWTTWPRSPHTEAVYSLHLHPATDWVGRSKQSSPAGVIRHVQWEEPTQMNPLEQTCHATQTRQRNVSNHAVLDTLVKQSWKWRQTLPIPGVWKIKILDKVFVFETDILWISNYLFKGRQLVLWKILKFEGDTSHGSLGLCIVIIFYKLLAHHSGKNLRWGVSNSEICSPNSPLLAVWPWAIYLSEFQLVIWEMRIKTPTSIWLL